MLALFEHAVDIHGGVDIVVANPGVGGKARKVADSAGKIIFVGSGSRHGMVHGL